MFDQMGRNEDKLGTRTRSLGLSSCGSLRGGLRRLADRIPLQKGVGDFRLVSDCTFRRDFNPLVLVIG